VYFTVQSTNVSPRKAEIIKKLAQKQMTLKLKAQKAPKSQSVIMPDMP
jgi:hypothetical protein